MADFVSSGGEKVECTLRLCEGVALPLQTAVNFYADIQPLIE